jgi:hypothetical protein
VMFENADRLTAELAAAKEENMELKAKLDKVYTAYCRVGRHG